MKYKVLQEFELDGTKFIVGSIVEFADSVAQPLLADGKIGDVDAPIVPAEGSTSAGTATEASEPVAEESTEETSEEDAPVE